MNSPSDPPPGLIPVPMKGAVLLLTAPEFEAGIRRGKAWRRRAALAERCGESPAHPPPGENPPPGHGRQAMLAVRGTGSRLDSQGAEIGQPGNV
ncbi:MAG: hypothetical protein NTW68_13535 [candidate division NC10 bacterium]|nr:hypothetical protein [candidate division NC10 bacterium]